MENCQKTLENITGDDFIKVANDSRMDDGMSPSDRSTTEQPLLLPINGPNKEVQQSSTAFTDPRPSKVFQLVFDDWKIDGVANQQIGPSFPTKELAKSYVRSQSKSRAKNLTIQEKDVEDEKFWIQITKKPKKRGEKKNYFVNVHETAGEFNNSLPDELAQYLNIIPYVDIDDKWESGKLRTKSGKPRIMGINPIYRAMQYFGYPKYLENSGGDPKKASGSKKYRSAIAPTILQYRNRNGNNDRWFWGTVGHKADFDQFVESLAEDQIDLKSLFDNGVAQIKGEDGKLSEEFINFAMAHGVSRTSGVPMAIGGPGDGSYPIGDNHSDWGLSKLQTTQWINSNLKNRNFKLGDLGAKGAGLTKLEKHLLARTNMPGYEDGWAESTQSSQIKPANTLPVLTEDRPLNVGDLNDWLNENEVGTYQAFPRTEFTKVPIDDFIDEMVLMNDDELTPLRNVNWNDVRWAGQEEGGIQPTFRMRTIGDRQGKNFNPLKQVKPSKESKVSRSRVWRNKRYAEQWSYRRKYGDQIYENASPIVFGDKNTARVIAAFQRSNGIPTRTIQIMGRATGRDKSGGGGKWINLMKKGLNPNLYLRRINNGRK